MSDRTARSRTRVKICGLTRPEDAAVAVCRGADYLGVVFAGGPRVADRGTAQGIVVAAAGRPVLGVFGKQTAEEILRLRDATGIAGAQLHDEHTADLAQRLRVEGMLVVRVVRLVGDPDLDRVAAAREASDAVLVEPRVPGGLGGTGATLPASLAARARGRLGHHPMFLAGGLTPENVAGAIALIQPDVVDVSSGVEHLPGQKDPSKIARFMEAVVGHYPTA